MCITFYSIIILVPMLSELWPSQVSWFDAHFRTFLCFIQKAILRRSWNKKLYLELPAQSYTRYIKYQGVNKWCVTTQTYILQKNIKVWIGSFILRPSIQAIFLEMVECLALTILNISFWNKHCGITGLGSTHKHFQIRCMSLSCLFIALQKCYFLTRGPTLL